MVNAIKYIIECEESLANAIRREVNQILVLAIENVEIHKNDSGLYDEAIAHRLGLIPIKSNRKLDELKEGEKPSNKTQISITLKEKGPKTVYSGDLKGDIEVIYKNMPIVILDKNQEIELLAFARLGKGINHAKYSPGLVFYRYITNLKVKNSEKAEEVLKKLNNKILNPTKSKPKSGEIFECVEDEDYIYSIDKEAFEVSDGNKIVFFIESWGQINSKQIFEEAVKSLNKNLKEVIKQIK